uniref:Flavin-containing monooxygenase n=1 Tax=Biomphalaria glabrata TaxID=6526 RepID=A0A2C9JSD5_BIOGL
METTVKVAVVGAGAAGLCALRHLTSPEHVASSHRFEVTCFEQSCRVGGTWIYTERTGSDEHGLPVHSSMYKNLRTNLPVQCMAFPDFPFKSGRPSFVTHEVVLDYLEDYTSHFDLFKHIKFQTLVKWIQPVNMQSELKKLQWELTTCDVVNKIEHQPELFDAILVCNGHYADPLIPDIPGKETYSGQVYHSHDYRVPETFSDKVVVILGAGMSGQDILFELSPLAKWVYLSHNQRPLTSNLPENVTQKPGIKKITGSLVHFLDGSQVMTDVVLLCTGYNYKYSFLAPQCGVKVVDGRVTGLYKHLFCTKCPSLAITGVCRVILPFPLFDFQVRLFKSVLEGTCVLPSKVSMDEDTENDYRKRLEEGMPHRYAHIMDSRQFSYTNDLADMTKTSRLSPFYSQLYYMCNDLRQQDLANYKNCNFTINEAGDVVILSAEGLYLKI